MKAGRDALQSLQSLQVYKALTDWVAGVCRSPDAAVHPFLPHLLPSLFISPSLSFLLFCRQMRHIFFSPFFPCTPSPSRRSARGPFGVRHLCSVIQSATALFIPDLFGALESPSLICEKILYFFFLLFSPRFIVFLPSYFSNANAEAVTFYFFGEGGCQELIWFYFILLAFIYLFQSSTQGTEGKKSDSDQLTSLSGVSWRMFYNGALMCLHLRLTGGV